MLMRTHTSLQAELAMATAAVKKRKRIVLTIEGKLEICKLVKQGETLVNVAALFIEHQLMLFNKL